MTSWLNTQIGSTAGQSDTGDDRNTFTGRTSRDTYPRYIFPYFDFIVEEAQSGEPIDINSWTTWSNVLHRRLVEL